MFGPDVIDRRLVGDRRQEATDEAHVVIPGQPADHAVVLAQIDAAGMAVKIVEQRLVGDGDPGGEAGRARGILEVTDILRVRFGQVGFGIGALAEIFPALAFASLPLSRRTRHFGDFRRIDQDLGVAAVELNRQLFDIPFLTAEAGRKRQGNRPGAGIDAAAEQGGEFRAGFRDQSHAIAFLDPHRRELARGLHRVRAHFAIGIDPLQRAAHIVEIEALFASGGIVDRFGEGREIGAAAGQIAIVRRRHRRRRLGVVTHRLADIREKTGPCGIP